MVLRASGAAAADLAQRGDGANDFELGTACSGPRACLRAAGGIATALVSTFGNETRQPSAAPAPATRVPRRANVSAAISLDGCTMGACFGPRARKRRAFAARSNTHAWSLAHVRVAPGLLQSRRIYFLKSTRSSCGESREVFRASRHLTLAAPSPRGATHGLCRRRPVRSRERDDVLVVDRAAQRAAAATAR